MGREAELARLRALTGQGTAGIPVVVAVSGPPGAGKTTLALRAAHDLAGRFPDGQLMFDLRGTDDDAPDAAELLLRVLKALGVADRDLAMAGPQGHPELCRRVLAERRCLLVLDNARDEAQVRPLLPGAGAGMVVVTSRRMLTGLESVHRLPSANSPAEAAVFLTSLVGQERAEAEPGALAEVAGHCGHLPLALRVAGNWLATRTGWTVRRLADRLALEERRLDALAAGDLRLSAAFDLSYRQLTPTAARMFRLLALVDGPDAGVAGAARLTGQSPFDAEDTLEELVETGLLGADRDRYRFHDLLRLYARDRLRAEEPAGAAEAARTALHRWLLETTVMAGRWYEPGHGARPPRGRAPSTCPPPSTPAGGSGSRASTGWPPCARPPRRGPRRRGGGRRGAALVLRPVDLLGHWPEVFATAARCAQALGDPVLEATHLNYHAWALLVCEGRHHDGLDRSAQALAAAVRAGDLAQQGWAHKYTAWAFRLLGDYAAAARHNGEAATLFEAAGDLHGALQCRVEHDQILVDGGGRRSPSRRSWTRSPSSTRPATASNRTSPTSPARTCGCSSAGPTPSSGTGPRPPSTCASPWSSAVPAATRPWRAVPWSTSATVCWPPGTAPGPGTPSPGASPSAPRPIPSASPRPGNASPRRTPREPPVHPVRWIRRRGGVPYGVLAQDRHPVERVDGDRHPDHGGDLVVGEGPAGVVIGALLRERVGGAGGGLGEASAARSRAVKSSVSRQAASTPRRRVVSPARRAARVCTSRQEAQPLIWDTRRLTSSTRIRSSPASAAVARTASAVRTRAW